MKKYPQNNSLGLGRVANIDQGVGGKVIAFDVLERINELHAGGMQEVSLNQNTTINLSLYRTWKITLLADITITLSFLDTYRYAFISVEPQGFTCTFNIVKKESIEDTRPYNHTFYKFFSPRPNEIELIEKATNMYGITEGEFEIPEFGYTDFKV